MRIKQLVLFGPGEDFRLQFGERLTVLAGLSTDERAELVEVLVEAMAGRLPNASVIYTDHAGRRVFADRTGATFADTGAPAPSLTDLLGTDPEVVSGLVTLRAADLGLGDPTERTAGDLTMDLAAERAAAAQIRAERDDTRLLVARVDEWRTELADLDKRIDRAPEDAARWEWSALRRNRDALRTELAALDIEADDGADQWLLTNLDELRSVGARWAEAGAEAAELAEQLGPLPDVSDHDLATVAATPASLPADFDDRLTAWQSAADARRSKDAALVEAGDAVKAPDDELVTRLAGLDQDQLWAGADGLVRARAAWEDELAALDGQTDPEIEADIEVAHREVVRCQRDRQRRFVPGILGASALAVGALLAGDQISVFVGMSMLIGSLAMAWWLLVVPRRVLALAERDEEIALGRADAGSWLGLHLRRIDDVMQPSDRKGVDVAVDAHAAAQLDWEELVGDVAVADAIARRKEVQVYADLVNPAMRTRRVEAARARLVDATAAEATARSRLTSGLDRYGFAATTATELEPSQLAKVIERRIAGGALARRAIRLRELQGAAVTSGAELDAVLRRLGQVDGALADRLDAALRAVAAAKRRQNAAHQIRPRRDLEAELRDLDAQVASGYRQCWDLTAEPEQAPVDPDVLVTRRLEVAELVRTSQGPDLVDAERRLSVVEGHIESLQADLDALAAGPAPLHQRMADRLARTASIGDVEESLPVVVDDALACLAPDEEQAALDVLARLSSRAQVILLTNRPLVVAWARSRAGEGSVSLFEADAVTAI